MNMQAGVNPYGNTSAKGTMPGLTPINPMNNFAQGLGVGQTIQSQLAARAAREAEAERKKNQQEAIDKAMTSGSAKDWFEVYNYTAPAELEKMKQAQSTFTSMQQDQVLADTAKHYSALNNGRPEIVKEDLLRRAEAASNSGDEATAKKLKSTANQLDTPEGINMYKGFLIQQAAGLPNGATLIDNLDTLQGMDAEIVTEGNNLEFASQEDFDRAYAKAQESGNTTAVKMLDLWQGFNSLKGMDAKDIVDAYLPIDKEYNDLVADYDIVLQNAENLENLGFLEGGAASQSMITLFNKVLDPNSVVRESEYANTAEAAGAINTLLQFKDKIISGESIGEDAQKRIIQAAKLMANVAEKSKIKVQEDIGKIIDEAGLKRDVVFQSAGTLEENELAKSRMLALAANPHLTAEQKKAVETMSQEELNEKFPNTMNKISGQVAETERAVNPDPEVNAFVTWIRSNPTWATKITPADEEQFSSGALTDIKGTWRNAWNAYQVEKNRSIEDRKANAQVVN
jgi:hypothetical protein